MRKSKRPALLCACLLFMAPLLASAQIVTFDDYLAAGEEEREAFFRDKFCKGVDIKPFYASMKASPDEEAKKAFMEKQGLECAKR